MTRPDPKTLLRVGPAALAVSLAGLIGCTRHTDLIVDGSLLLSSTELIRGQDTLVVRFEMADAALVRFEVWNLGGHEKWHSADTSLAAGADYESAVPRYWDDLDVGIYEFRVAAVHEGSRDEEAIGISIVD